jgi:hypothetical protein
MSEGRILMKKTTTSIAIIQEKVYICKEIKVKMNTSSPIDIKENELLSFDRDVLSTLLLDHSSGKNIIWATDNYASLGKGYQFGDQITIPSITGKNGDIVQPRVSKSKEIQQSRIRDKAEVFTPCWICNAQNNMVDEAWFGHKSPFNTETEEGWKTTSHPIVFPDTKDKRWQDYVADMCMEITCGEAPYLVSRYGAITGKPIPVADRIGLLDRKMRVVRERAGEEWLHFARLAFESIYGYEWQGDNLLIARENLLSSFIDYYVDFFGTMPPMDEVRYIAEIISWNIWQMDGLKGVIPCSCHPVKTKSQNLFGGDDIESNECPGCAKDDIHSHNGKYCRIMDWQTNTTKRYIDLIK